MASEPVTNGALANGKASKKRKHRAEQEEVADGESEKPSREERREAKRLKKPAKEDALPMVNSSRAAVVDDITSVDAKDAKPKRKGDKRKRKREEKALQSQKVVESETAGALTMNGDTSKAESEERGAMNEDRMQMIENAEARYHGTVEGKKIARTEKNARNKQKKKAKKAERIQGTEPAKVAASDLKVDVSAGSKEKESSHEEDSVSLQPSEKAGEVEDAFKEESDSVRQERKQREKEERRNARRAARNVESAKGVEEVSEPAKVVTDELSEERRQRKEEARKVAKKLKPTAIPADSDKSIKSNMTVEIERERDQRKQEAITEIDKLERRKPKVKQPQTEKANATLPDLPQGESSGQPSDPTVGYIEDSVLQGLPQATIEDFLSSNNVAIRDLATDKAPSQRPIIDFKYLPTIPGLTSAKSPFADFKAPTPIQAAAWPHLLSSRDVIGVAETGSGKTLAFGLPCIQHITSLQKTLPSKSPVRAVIVSPTRELASQIHTQIVALAEPASLHAICLYGGIPKHQQRADLKNAHIIIATPGRLNDLIEEGHADLSRVTYLVLDEADRMLDKGFEEAISTIISRTPPTGRQTAMFTATWPASVRELAATFMTDPIRITISSSINGADNPNGELRANPNITQHVEVMDPHSKEGRLRELVKALSPPSENTSRKQSSMVNKAYPIKMQQNRVLIFCLYKKEADRIEKMLRKAMAGSEIRIAAIHGDMSQPLRTASLSAFKKGEVSVLVATDVAARGLDIPDVKAVINFTFPLTVEDYVHRIGRTGRAGKDGLAVTFFTESEKGLAGGLTNVLKGAGQEVPEELLKFGTTVKKKTHEAYGNFYREVREGEKKEGTMTRLS